MIKEAELQKLKDLTDKWIVERKQISQNFAEFADAAEEDKISDWLKAQRQKAQRAVLNQSKGR
jgi:hypothetical protein